MENRIPYLWGGLDSEQVGNWASWDKLHGQELQGLGSRFSTAPLSNSWIMIIIWFYKALNRTPSMDCYWVGAVPKGYPCLRLHEAVGVWRIRILAFPQTRQTCA